MDAVDVAAVTTEAVAVLRLAGERMEDPKNVVLDAQSLFEDEGGHDMYDAGEREKMPCRACVMGQTILARDLLAVSREAELLADDAFEVLSSEDDEEHGDPTDYLEHYGGAACAAIFRRAADALESGGLAISYREDYGFWTAGRAAAVVAA